MRGIVTPEEWRDIPGYEGYYQASDLGRVRSKTGRLRKLVTDKAGYQTIQLFRDGEMRQYGVNQLVMWAFIGPTPEGMEIFYNGDKTDNSLGNLRFDRRALHGVKIDKICNHPDCDGLHFARRLCRKHYERAKLAGTWDDLPPAGYGNPCSSVTAHRRVKRMWGPAGNYPCVECGGMAAQWAYDGADPDQNFGPVSNRGSHTWMAWSAYPEFYMPMCARCHTARDAAIAKEELREYRQWKHATGLTLADIAIRVGIPA